MHAQSVEDPASFWGEIAEKFHWKMSPTKDNFLSYNFNVNNGPIEVSELIFLITRNSLSKVMLGSMVIYPHHPFWSFILQIKWMCDGKLNICYNALDRHLDKKGSQVKY